MTVLTKKEAKGKKVLRPLWHRNWGRGDKERTAEECRCSIACLYRAGTLLCVNTVTAWQSSMSCIGACLRMFNALRLSLFASRMSLAMWSRLSWSTPVGVKSLYQWCDMIIQSWCWRHGFAQLLSAASWLVTWGNASLNMSVAQKVFNGTFKGSVQGSIIWS